MESAVVVESFFASFTVSFVVDDVPYVTVVFDGLTLRRSVLTHPERTDMTVRLSIIIFKFINFHPSPSA